MIDPPSSPPRPSPPSTGGRTAGSARDLLHSTDWSQTALGPMEQWPQSLRIAVDICLSSRFPMFVWWGPTFINIYNDAYVPVLGKRHPQAFGRPARESWHEIWDALSGDIDAVMVRGEATWNDRVLLVMERNGFTEETWFTWSYSPIRDGDGAIRGLFCACTEETAHVHAERERDRLMRQAQDAARNLRTWFDNAPGFVALLRGPHFVFESVNQAYYQLVGHRRIEGLPVFEALPEVRGQGFEELLQGVYDTGVPFVGRALRFSVQREPSGPTTEGFIDLLYQPVRDGDGSIVGIFVQGHDVTEQVRAVQGLKDADRLKDEFLATLAHELRNPLAPIRQAANLAKAPGVDAARQTWALEVIERQAGHMALLLDDLLDVSRISRGKLELRVQDADLRDVVNAAIEACMPLMDRKRHQLEIRLPAQRVQLRADPIRLTQVVQNLLSNAAKYTDPGGVIQLAAALAPDELVIEVVDNGIGLSAAAQTHVFEMFSQVSSAIDRAEGGLGIGLALSKGVVELHGGRIAAHSGGPGQGSRFEIRLPRQAPAAVPDAAPAPIRVAERPARTVLLADDNADALQTLSFLLEADGHTVLTASNGDQALALAESARPEVAVLDIGMPGLNGYAAARAIRGSTWGGGMQLIALTGWGQAEDHARSRAAGFDHHLTKPVELAVLQDLVRQGR